MAEKLNIAIFTSAARGLAHYVAQLYPELSKYANLYYVTYSGQEVDLLAKEEAGRIYQIIQDQSASSMLEVIRFLKNKKIDVINLQVSDTVRRMHMQYIAMISLAKSNGISVAMTIHDVFTIESMDIEPAAVELLYSLADTYIVGNDSEKDRLEYYFNVPEEKIVVVPHGPYTLFDKHRYSQEHSKKVLGLENKNVILFFGQIRPNKGLKYLIKAFPMVIKEHPDSVLYISTDLHLSTPELNEYLRRVERSEASKKIVLVKDYIPSDEVEKVFKAADIVALPYIKVSQSGVLNIAYAFKKPVVVSDVFHEAHQINGKFGYTFRSQDHKQLAAAINKILSLNDKGAVLGQNGYEYATQKANWKNAAELTFEACQKAAQLVKS